MLDVLKYPLVSDQIDYAELSVIIQKLESVLNRNVVGDVVELGCYEGTTSLFLQRVLQASGSEKMLHIYDSFSGLPDKVVQDISPAGEQFKAGELHASKQRLIQHFKHAGLSLPRIHKVWFESLKAKDLPSAICFAFLDGDFYTSIASSLKSITPFLQSGAIILIDDYQSEALPGAKKATDEWARAHRLAVTHQQSLGIIQWP